MKNQFSLDSFLLNNKNNNSKNITQENKNNSNINKVEENKNITINSKIQINTLTNNNNHNINNNNKNQNNIISKRKVIDDELPNTDLENPEKNNKTLPSYDNNIEKEINKTQQQSQISNISSKNDSLPFNELVTTLLKVESTKGENSKDQIKEHFSNLFINIINNYPNDLPKVYYFLSSKVGPEYRSPEFGIGNGILEKITAKVIGVTDKQLKEKLVETGDLGTVACNGKSHVKTMDKFTNFIKIGPTKDLTMSQVMNIFNQVAGKKGKSSQDEKSKLLCKIMFQANKDEIKFIIRSLQKSLKIGASFKTILSSLARAIYKLLDKNINKKLEEKEIYSILLMSKNQLCDEDIFFKHIIYLLNEKKNFKELIKLCKIKPGIPVSPQLARPTNGINVIFGRFENIPFTCEFKYDGFRGQIHYYDNKTEIFSRNLENMTETYPDIAEFVNKFKAESQEKNSDKILNNFIIDCEMVAFDTKNNKILPFQQLTTRNRKNVDINTITIHVCMFVFDILYLNDEILIEKTLKERREILYNTFTENNTIQFAKHLNSENQDEIEKFMNESIESGCEGLIVKAIEKNSQYMPGQRNFNWLKLKKDYLDTSLGDSIDLVVIGAQYGKGKRAGFYGSFLLACYNDDNETFESVSMTGGGLKDNDIESIFNELKEHTLPKKPSNYRIGEIETDVIFEPIMVWEVKTADLTLSPVYTAGSDIQSEHKGISLRFPRFIRTRPDKKPEEVITSEEIIKLYNNQASITKNNLGVGNVDIDDIY